MVLSASTTGAVLYITLCDRCWSFMPPALCLVRRFYCIFTEFQFVLSRALAYLHYEASRLITIAFCVLFFFKGEDPPSMPYFLKNSTAPPLHREHQFCGFTSSNTLARSRRCAVRVATPLPTTGGQWRNILKSSPIAFSTSENAVVSACRCSLARQR